MTDGERRHPDMVWYAGYGSNLSAERFLCYIAGGTPRGAARPCRGARDTTPPRGDRPLEVPYRLYFSGHSTMWDGAPAFIDTVERTDPPARARARAYLITWEQFEDVVAQENGRPTTAPVELEGRDLATGFRACLGTGRYEHLLCVGTLEGFPVVTFTSPWPIADADIGTPSPAYLKVMIEGLRESHALDDDAVVGYLGAAPGCSEDLARAALAAPSNDRDRDRGRES